MALLPSPIPPSSEETEPTVSLKPFPALPPSDRLKKIPAALARDNENVPDATGNKPYYDVPHDFSSPSNQPNWLNDNGGQTRTCRVCGVTERRDLVRVDRKGMNYHYVDAMGLTITSLVPLSCPTFIGDTNGTLAETKGRVRKHDVQLETVDARLDRLEADNIYLRSVLETKIELDLNGLVAWLAQMSQLSAQAQLPTTPIEITGLSYEVPVPIAELVQGVGVTIVVTPEDEK